MVFKWSLDFFFFFKRPTFCNLKVFENFIMPSLSLSLSVSLSFSHFFFSHSFSPPPPHLSLSVSLSFCHSLSLSHSFPHPTLSLSFSPCFFHSPTLSFSFILPLPFPPPLFQKCLTRGTLDPVAVPILGSGSKLGTTDESTT